MRKLFILIALIFCSALSAQNSKVKTLTIEPQAEPSVGLGKIYFGLDGKMYLYDGTAWNYQILNNDAQFIANTAKIGITPTQAADIVTNNAKIGITPSQAADIVTNNAKVGITPTQAADIITNNAKVGITPTQASNITANNAKISNATHTGDVTGSTALTIANNSVTSAKIVDGTILPADLANQSYGLLGYSQVGTATTYGIATVLDNILGQSNITPAAPSSSSDLLLTRESSIPTNTKLSSIQQIADKMSIGSAQIADGSIATADLADVSITNAKLADNSVGGGNIIDGSIALAELSATGTPSASTYLRGDNTWATVAGGGTAATTSYDNTTSGLTASNVQDAVDELIVSAPLQITASRTLTDADLNRILWSNTGTELELTINTGLGSNGDIIYLMPYAANSVLKPVAGTGTLLNTYKTDVNIGNVLTYKKVNGVWIADPRDGVAYSAIINLMNDSNAASPDNEANATTGFTNTGSTIQSSATSPILGLYSIVFNAASGSGGERLNYSLIGEVSNGDSIRVQFDYIMTSTATVTAWQGMTSPTGANYTSDGTLRSFDFTTTITDDTIAELRWYPGTVVSGGVKIDNLLITKL